ncbi:GlyGly-CTERM sorting domain-containing protein [Vibrio parahaemolyticus]|uniref:trypsin-like serine protease n=1 Tax=Vibrio parahaemolyticus TaxID=670 RepID=UPI001B83B928|nr:trypsin-like serine protease [Vibrio parahaemolyticus]EGQ8549699.1 GlyGly-CTERM sorting domain-containing protein [Vibrio parahaemolyticus]EGQ9074419.1 GlyGly-CTERM sorting domain-containing protein [Vibrio parahaemolyticus]EGQ9130554.1 GlyGly-CTERM sorting domain-containing protein [Vibrio parahaemolyticus]EIO3217281.1 GlyGly-CTERM sorting domain-containing protein [Vibrio parahaemolyticus]EJB8439250.1 GlyGly-CTERM sorting domain-containing protein [Vibrio parahaemolyticus]
MRLPSLSLIALSLLSASSYAVENGTPVDWDQYDDSVRLENPTGGNCTATLLAGRYAITAGHCLEETGIDRLTTAHNTTTFLTDQWLSPEYTDEYGRDAKDVGIVLVDSPVDYRHIQFLNIDEQNEGEPMVIRGFGGTIDSLNQADFTFSNYHWDKEFRVYADMVNESHTTGGDSGAAWTINKDGNEEIIAIHRGKSTNPNTMEFSADGTTIQSVQDFITDTIDGWHYPTLANTDENGKATITVQSLHRDIIFDSAWGDNVTITGGTCLDGSPINPFDKCTYDIENDGTQGELYLSDDEVIHINKPIENTGGGDSGNNNTDNDDSGGSMGFWSLLLLGVATLRRKR